MIIHYITDQKPGETDVLSDLRFSKLIIRSLEGEELFSQDAPETGWTHDLLCMIQPDSIGYGADAYLNGSWIGSTEV